MKFGRSAAPWVLALATCGWHGCAPSRSSVDPRAPEQTPQRDKRAVAVEEPARVAAPAPTPAPAAAPSTAAAASTMAASEATPAMRWVQLTPQIRCNVALGVVEIDAVAVLKVGFLEQYVCLVGTREHEALFAFEGKASEVHAALVLIGLEAGAPGRWREVPRENDQSVIERVAPTGPALRIAVRLADGTERPIEWFARAAPIEAEREHANDTPPSRFVFAGSRFVTNRRTGEERYAADSSGSLIGLVTFGDETIAAIDVIPDQAQIAEPVWEAATERMPEPGTRVKIMISSRESASRSDGTPRAELRSIAANRHQIWGERKRPGRGRASDRALPGASDASGDRLTPTSYTDFGTSQHLSTTR